MQALGIRPPRVAVAVVGERDAQILDVAGEPIARELAQQLLLARIAAVQRADPHARFLGHVRDRRRWVGEERAAARMSSSLRAASARRPPGCDRDRATPLTLSNGTECSVLIEYGYNPRNRRNRHGLPP